MSFALTSLTRAESIKARTWSESPSIAILTFEVSGGHSQLHVPRHVAEATAKAFNRAMQVTVTGRKKLAYATDAGIFHISTDDVMGTVWLAQHDEITGDGDPAWMTADAHSLEALQDTIDDQVKEHLEDAAQAAGIIVNQGERIAELEAQVAGLEHIIATSRAWEAFSASLDLINKEPKP